MIEVRREDHRSLAEYATIRSAFHVGEALMLAMDGDAIVPHVETRPIRPGYDKDYDALPGNHPGEWPARFSVERACLLAAYVDGDRIGGAIVICDPDDVVRLRGERGLALLWDLRVARRARRRGVARALLAAAEASARDAEVRGLLVETQDVNVPACRVYAAAGFVLASVEHDAYPGLPGEARLIWTKTFEAT